MAPATATAAAEEANVAAAASTVAVAVASGNATEYERLRQERIARNRMALMSLQVHQLKEEVKQAVGGGARRVAQGRERRERAAGAGVLEASPAETRRSSRLEGRPAVKYSSEALDQSEHSSNGGQKGKRKNALQPQVRREELYDSEDEKLLGSFQEPWELFVDGFDKDGKRVYDPVRGTTCHQCRQKTLGQRTKCGECQSLRGQFCGDCLFMRYGENVREALASNAWACPVCRGICNCSFCRLKRGWTPTGTLYRQPLYRL